jgi:hypothetical protein
MNGRRLRLRRRVQDSWPPAGNSAILAWMSMTPRDCQYLASQKCVFARFVELDVGFWWMLVSLKQFRVLIHNFSRQLMSHH